MINQEKTAYETWYPFFRDFCENYPYWANRVIDWWIYGQCQIVVDISDVGYRLYDNRDGRVTVLDNVMPYMRAFEEDDYMDEWTWGYEFGRLLGDKITRMDMTQEEVARLTGISAVSINTYVNGKTTPSLYLANKIANVLKCSLNEFYIPNYRGPKDVAYVRTHEFWDDVLNDLKFDYPGTYHAMTRWYPVGLGAIAVCLDNGERYLYQHTPAWNRDLVYIYSDDYGPCVEFDEMSYRRVYAENLNKFMVDANVGRTRLAAYTDISTISMYKYISGRAIPSLYNATKIARALDRSLVDFQVC